jgi:hypothetical protein
VVQGLPLRVEGGVPREQKMLKGHLPRVIYPQVNLYTKIMKTVERVSQFERVVEYEL